MLQEKYGNLLVLEYLGKCYYKCSCSCGNAIIVRKDKLIGGFKTDCGCLQKLEYRNKWLGLRFHKLEVKDLLGNRKALCKCDCGNDTVVFLNNLTRNNTTSCGCIHKAIAGLKHGLLKDFKSEYRSWAMMKNRCLNPNAQNKKYYRDKCVCPEWKNSFEVFFRDMGEKPFPKKDYSIERINNLYGYFKGNCKWGTRKEQANNRRKRNSVPD